MSKQQDVIAELLNSVRDKDSDKEEEKIYGEEHLDQLRTACDNFLRKEDFKVGQIVKWKKDLKNRRLPHKNQPAIVVRVLDEPIVNTDDESGSPYFLEKLDIVLGVMSNDGTFLTFYYDSSRFESYCMPKKVVGIHLVCRKGLNVEDLENGYFKSGHWKISESSAITAQYIALHESKNQPSYKQGIIENWERSEERPDRIIFYVKATDEQKEWMGGGAGEKGYFWSDE